jgi:signal transduction histidine kinase
MTTAAEEHVELPRWQRMLLPGELRDGARGRRSARDWVVDVAMYVIAAGISALVLGSTAGDHSELEIAVDLALGVVAFVALWFRRSHPVAVGVTTGVCSLASGTAGGPALLALFNVAIRASRRAILGIIALALASTAIFPLLYAGDEPYGLQIVFGVLITGVVVGWGLFVRVQRELVLSLRERAATLEAEQRLRVEQAREAERLRIAREMHDVLAHRVSLLSLHAGALEFHPDAPAEEVAHAAAVIRSSAHAALEELRDVIGVLREGEAEGARGGAPEPPQPTLAEIPALVEESRQAGMRVRCHIDVPADAALPTALGRAAYRIVQEGLTNARKHAPAAAVEVTITAQPGASLVAEVVSRCPAGVAAPAAFALPGAGTGLVGLAERVALAGGELEHGPDDAGDFVLRATLPWSP